jgi:hypothetical protein
MISIFSREDAEKKAQHDADLAVEAMAGNTVARLYLYDQAGSLLVSDDVVVKEQRATYVHQGPRVASHCGCIEVPSRYSPCGKLLIPLDSGAVLEAGYTLTITLKNTFK